MPKKIKLFIIHFQPLKLYPPVMNMIDFLGKDKNIDLVILSNKKEQGNSLAEFKNEEVKIFRPAFLDYKGFRQYFNYVKFYVGSLYYLLKYKPDTVLYIETLSSWPAIIYKRLARKKIKLMVHYHEYTEPKLYKEGMLLSKWMHRFEKKNYCKYSWISHTNKERLQFFKDDCNLNTLDNSIFHVIPNYPSKNWSNSNIKDFSKQKTKRLVFVGSLGYKNMYLQEVIDWLSQHPTEFSLDIYSYNIDAKAKEAIQNCDLSNLQYFGGCNYKDLPKILKNYDIGLVIYKPFSVNTIHAVSNKVFEYLSCGLDVWFSEDMTYTFNYFRDNVYPKVLPVNFKKLKEFDYDRALSREGLHFEPSNYFYEKVYPELIEDLFKKVKSEKV